VVMTYNYRCLLPAITPHPLTPPLHGHGEGGRGVRQYVIGRSGAGDALNGHFKIQFGEATKNPFVSGGNPSLESLNTKHKIRNYSSLAE
jgi:hypothetical protein